MSCILWNECYTYSDILPACRKVTRGSMVTYSIELVYNKLSSPNYGNPLILSPYELLELLGKRTALVLRIRLVASCFCSKREPLRPEVEPNNLACPSDQADGIYDLFPVRYSGKVTSHGWVVVVCFDGSEVPLLWCRQSRVR